MHDVTHAAIAGWLPDAGLAWVVAGVWVAVVLVYGLYRSAGEAKQDPIRESGPIL